MNKLLAGILTVGFIFTSTQSFSNDKMKDHLKNSQMMKDCMARMTAKNDGSTKDQMKTACRTEMTGGMSKGNTTQGESLVHGDMNTPPR